MDRPGMPTQKEARRLAEIIRKRKYRASKRSELIELESQARRLTAYLSEQKRAIRARQLARAKEETLSLQTQVSQYHCLTQIFSQCVHVNEHPQKDLSNRSTWFESTLLAHPISRRQGIQWLSERVYHQARRMMPLSEDAMDTAYVLPLVQPYQGQTEMVFSFNAHLADELDEDGVTIAALETRFRHTLPTDFRSAASVDWGKVVGTNSTFTSQLLERVDDRFAYSTTQTIALAPIFFPSPDELFPLEDGVLRPHGFSWTIYEAVSSGVTLVHNFALQYTPIMANGRVIPLERIGRLFGLSPAGVHHRDAYIQRVWSAAEPLSSIPKDFSPEN
ncbi:hypothetical protein Ae201684_012910 [Aphanomyces euteiches]|uniref:Uncharacterized protein n=1 Tax=Aphanomyces euteiches TaxID=100861 RepID=A0A6G0WPR8_9STRA|nr:hypothetical protein Ae201684_012910 [Aphanomyces euteiches]KAH9153406.1 hypothetical protein AeRB84_004336 [Aphanomyces euteiches]